MTRVNNYLNFVNERLGINDSIEQQVDLYMQEIKDNPDKNEFEFTYNLNGRKYPFTLKIFKLEKGTYGKFKIDKGIAEIHLLDRDSKSVLLHELKHLDYFIRRNNCFNTLLKVAHDKLSSIKNNDELSLVKNYFYLYDQNEFESRLHEYYINFDNYVSERIDQVSKPSDIYDLFEEYLSKSKDKSWTFYIRIENFKFEDLLSDRQINRLFINYIIQDNKYNYSDINDILRYIRLNFKKLTNFVLNKYNEEDLKKAKKIKKEIEYKINKKIPIYRKKIYKLVTLVGEKHNLL